MLANVKKANVSKDTNYILDNQIYNQIDYIFDNIKQLQNIN